MEYKSQFTSNLTVGAYCNLGSLSSAFPEEEPDDAIAEEEEAAAAPT